MEWLVDGKRYSPSGLVRAILKEGLGVQPAVQGTKWWVTEDGVDLATLAYGTTLRDWTDLHQLITKIRPGEWTTYGDIGHAIGLPAQPVGTHIATCGECPYGAHRVLTVNGSPSESFRWSDPAEVRTCREVLESEGLVFDSTGHADPTGRLDADALTGRSFG